MASLVNTRIKMIMVMLAVLIAFAALAGGVFAKGPPPGDIPAADGTINACYKTHKDDNEKKGQLRLDVLGYRAREF